MLVLLPSSVGASPVSTTRRGAQGVVERGSVEHDGGDLIAALSRG
ncbi:hypothetical protein Ae406Ps2_6248 [Pseudonocardia sp. Ae406_Ps2]|nr:hypothetical protein Ae406Ps2_6248 [Pseudonocardia sp. Ae406_Ps2]